MLARKLMAIACVVAAAMSALEARADGALAIGIGRGGLSGGWVYGMSYNATSTEEAQRTAMRYCQGLETENNKIPDNAGEAQKACRIVSTFSGTCIAVAQNGSQTKAATGMGWSNASDEIGAKEGAMNECRKGTGPSRAHECYVADSFCDVKQ